MHQEQPNNDRKRTRIDPYADVWDTDILPLLKVDAHGKLYARTILEELMEKISEPLLHVPAQNDRASH